MVELETRGPLPRLTADSSYLVRVPRDHVRLLADQELAAHGEARVAFDFGDVGFLEESESPPAGTRKDVLGLDDRGGVGEVVLLHRDEPTLVRLLLEGAHRGEETDFATELRE